MSIHEYQAAFVLDQREQLLNKTAEDLENLIVEVANSSGDLQIKNLEKAVVRLRILKSRWKGLRAILTEEDVPLGDRPMEPF